MRLRMTLDRIGMALGDAPPPPPDPAPNVVDTVDAQFMEAMQVYNPGPDPDLDIYQHLLCRKN